MKSGSDIMYFAVVELSGGKDVRVSLFEEAFDAEAHQRSLEDAYVQRVFELYNEETVQALELEHAGDQQALFEAVCDMQNHPYVIELHTVALSPDSSAAYKRTKLLQLEDEEEDEVYEEEEEEEDEE